MSILGRLGYGALAPVVVAASLAWAPAAAAAPAPRLDDRTAVYELRTYYAMPGKLEALNSRFRDHTLTIFKRHGMTSVAYWNDRSTPDGRVIYILAYPSREAREASWAEFRKDPEWQAVAKASEANGKLVDHVDSVFMNMTDYSPRLRLDGRR